MRRLLALFLALNFLQLPGLSQASQFQPQQGIFAGFASQAMAAQLLSQRLIRPSIHSSRSFAQLFRGFRPKEPLMRVGAQGRLVRLSDVPVIRGGSGEGEETNHAVTPSDRAKRLIATMLENGWSLTEIIDAAGAGYRSGIYELIDSEKHRTVREATVRKWETAWEFLLKNKASVSRKKSIAPSTKKDAISNAEWKGIQKVIQEAKRSKKSYYRIGDRTVTPQTLGRIARGKQRPRRPFYEKIYASLGLPVPQRSENPFDGDWIPNTTLTDDEVQAYLGPTILQNAKAEGRRFSIRRLDPKADKTFLDQWGARLEQDAAWLEDWNKKEMSDRLPRFSYLEEFSFGLVSEAAGIERLEGYIGFQLVGKGHDAESRTSSFQLGIPQIELYYPNIGRNADIPSISDLLIRVLIKTMAEKDFLQHGFELYPVTPGADALVDRWSIDIMEGNHRGLTQEHILQIYDDESLRDRFNASRKPTTSSRKHSKQQGVLKKAA